MLLRPCLGWSLLGLATAAPIAFASQKNALAHADWVNLDHRRLLLPPDENNIRVVAGINSRDTTTLRQSQLHLAANPSNRKCNSPGCVSSWTTSRKSPRPRAVDTGSMVSAFLYCILAATVGCVFLTMLLVKLYLRQNRVCRLEDDHSNGMGMKKWERFGTADDEVSDDFDDTDYPMG